MNYYEILNVSKNASREDITIAHKRLAMKLHPDRNKNNKQAEEQFKIVNNAYNILNNPATKAIYDLELENANKPKTQNESQNTTNNENQNSTQIKKETFTQQETIPVRIGFWEAIKGGDIFAEFYRKGQYYNVHLQADPCIETGALFLVNIDGVSLHIVAQVSEDEIFTRKGRDLYAEVNVPFHIALLGGNARFENYNGDLLINIPKGSKQGSTLVSRGAGLKIGNAQSGDLYLKVNLILPENLTDKQVELIKEFTVIESKKEKGLFYSRAAPFWENIRNMFIPKA